MKRIIILFIALCLVLFANAQRVLPKPNPPRLVNDMANLLTPDQAASLEAKLVAYDDSTSNQIVVVTVTTLNGLDPNDYATELGRSWGVGGSNYNNGVVVLISAPPENSDEKRKVYISAGYGLEGALPDITLKQIIENEMVPNLKAGNFYRAVDEATSALIRGAAGEYKAPAGYNKRGNQKGIPAGLIFFIIILVIVIMSRRGGGGGGGMMSRRGFRGWNSGPPIIFFPGGSGGSGGGGSGWSGGGGGGGFGGFGGGGFGGGGAGGSW